MYLDSPTQKAASSTEQSAWGKGKGLKDTMENGVGRKRLCGGGWIIQSFADDDKDLGFCSNHNTESLAGFLSRGTAWSDLDFTAGITLVAV